MQKRLTQRAKKVNEEATQSSAISHEKRDSIDLMGTPNNAKKVKPIPNKVSGKK